jgi:hypothetical protein
MAAVSWCGCSQNPESQASNPLPGPRHQHAVRPASRHYFVQHPAAGLAGGTEHGCLQGLSFRMSL